ncbi:hypothetical protein ColTof4_01958 [Colletotrichum tofieldiae]|nr:hypothetical protein ColTof3_09758 [Colletotrichum tofieldiae]GKT69535.1 hypothetical protein ColTof4_01958 [Colletotrichum tofieldiae]GKT96155.1 hypothetical protein Ct61P_14005 [Colletotrichum tofieldiae]
MQTHELVASSLARRGEVRRSGEHYVDLNLDELQMQLALCLQMSKELEEADVRPPRAEGFGRGTWWMWAGLGLVFFLLPFWDSTEVDKKALRVLLHSRTEHGDASELLQKVANPMCMGGNLGRSPYTSPRH